MSVETAAADVALRHEEFVREGVSYGKVHDLRASVKAEIETLNRELAYWDGVADTAWHRLMLADALLSDSRDRLRAEIRRRSSASLEPERIKTPVAL